MCRKRKTSWVKVGSPIRTIQPAFCIHPRSRREARPWKLTGGSKANRRHKPAATGLVSRGNARGQAHHVGSLPERQVDQSDHPGRKAIEQVGQLDNAAAALFAGEASLDWAISTTPPGRVACRRRLPLRPRLPTEPSTPERVRAMPTSWFTVSPNARKRQ